jgi:endogenous inhibitor of DNA gyrase (YacG/DUF329 family)
VLFRSAQSTHAVCGYCQSTVVRTGEVLSRIGKMAELFDDHSPLQLGVTGRVAAAVAVQGSASATVGFVVVGRLQYQSAQGVWTEWVVLQDDGQTASLSEDNGSYVYARPRAVMRSLPDPRQLRLGATTAVDGRSYTITSNVEVSLRSAQGELSHLPELGRPFAMVELRSQGDVGGSQGAGSVLTLDCGPTLSGQPVAVSLGQEVKLDALSLTGLKLQSEREEQGRQFNCPACGAPVTVDLGSTQRLTCGSCHSLIDLSKGVGAELVHARQHEPVAPLIALGSTGRMQGRPWQVVGFQHRMGHDPSDPDEHFGWDEYLLYNTKMGFQFLVDATDGWSLVKPTTGVPVLGAGAQSATYLGTTYQLQWAYNAETTYVAGEFYWPVERGQKSFNRDFASGQSLLSQEQTPQELVWSSGSRMHAKIVADAFGMQDKLAQMARNDAAPVSLAGGGPKVLVLVAILLVVLLLNWLESRDNCDPTVQNCSASTSRSSGGSWGGYSSGGFHK